MPEYVAVNPEIDAVAATIAGVTSIFTVVVTALKFEESAGVKVTESS